MRAPSPDGYGPSMADITTGVELLGPSALTLKLLGPTVNYLGSGLQAWSETRVENIRGIFSKAEQKVEMAALLESGAVPPRVLRGVLSEGSFVTDELFQDYFGGVLLSSHSEGGRDDRAATYIELLSRLSTYQIRTHYVLYSAAQAACYMLPEVDLSDVAGRERVGDFFVRFPKFIFALDLSDDEMDDLSAVLTHALVGLHREGLIGVHWHFSTDVDNVSASEAGRGYKFPCGGLVFGISMFGIELFAAAHGFSGEPARTFTEPTASFDAAMSTPVPRVSAERIADLPSRA
jgi:hypothetical protein